VLFHAATAGLASKKGMAATSSSRETCTAVHLPPRAAGTYDRLRHTHDIAEARSNMGLMQFLDRLQGRVRGRS
jgi:hypothetical protein